jgi:lysophospholipase L1-like esterase
VPAPRRVLAALLAAVATLLGLVGMAAPAAADARPTAVVALGDSAAAGDGAGDYVAGTRGEGGNWCHRSPHAYVHVSGLAAESVNLACSGAEAADVAFGSPTHYTEGSQAERLADVALRYRVTAVTLQVGANDDPELIGTLTACIRTFVDPRQPPCRETIGPSWPARLAAMAPKVEAAVRDVRAAMRRAGYADSEYAFVLASYASPITEHMVAGFARGCPYSRADAAWGRTVALPELSTALRGVAERSGVRFLDLSRASEGYEACARLDASQEWQRRLTVDPRQLAHGGLGVAARHVAQESFHPTARGHAEMGRCLGEFVRSAADSGACLVGRDGQLHADLRVTAA